MVPGWKHAVVSQLHIDREKNKSFYVVAEAGLKMFHSSCSLATDCKRTSPEVMEVFGLFIGLAVLDVLRNDNREYIPTITLIHKIYNTLVVVFPKDNCQKLCCGRC